MGTPSTTNGVGYDTFEPGRITDNGSIDVGYNFRPGASDARPSFDDGTSSTLIDAITIEFDSTHDTGALCAFNGFFTDDGWDAPNEDNMTGSGTIKIDGIVQWTAAASAALFMLFSLPIY
jgi:hypothetical protein